MISQLITIFIIISIIGIIMTLTATNSIDVSDVCYDKKVAQFNTKKMRFGLLFFISLLISIILFNNN